MSKSIIKNSKISVICPVYNSREYVLNSLESIISQSVKPFELIIVDDGSTDGTPDFIFSFLTSKNVKFHWKIIKLLHRGPGASRNSGILAAKGDWISFIDSDDIWSFEKLSKVKNVISTNHEINFICHHEKYKKINGTEINLDFSENYNPQSPLSRQLFKRNLFSTSAVTCKRDLLIEGGLFDEHLMSIQDYELWLRLSRKINLLFIKERLGFYVQREGNITSGNWFKRMKNETKILYKYRSFVPTPFFLARIFIFFSHSLIINFIKNLKWFITK